MGHPPTEEARLTVGGWPTRDTGLCCAGLLALTALRLFVAANIPLSPDEAYYWVWSKALAPGYLDHPPMVACWIRAGTNVIGNTALGVRFLAPLAALAGSLLLADAGRVLFAPRTGLLAAVLLNATLMLGAGAVTMTPDTPLLFFWTAAMWALARVRRAPAWWLVVGLAAGLALDSKYTAALLGLGIALWLLTPAMRPALRTAWPWAGGVLALLLTAPVVWWNATHGWASFAKQGGRTADWAPARALQFQAELLGGQIGLATPLLFALLLWGSVAALRRWRDPTASLLAALVWPGAAVFVQHAIGDRVQANWLAILYPAAALAAAAFTGPRLIRPAITLGALLTATIYLQATAAPFPLPSAVDPLLRLTAGWDQLAEDATERAGAEHAAFLASEEYGTASLLAWWGHFPTVAAAPRWRLFDLPPAPTGPGLLLLSTRRREPPNPALWSTATPTGTLTRTRGNTEIETYRLYRVTLQPGAAAVLLPEGEPR